ncbi:hypothetical protein RIF29_21312 [Crotalaria pallida]|uniref:G domain-containing protein n=1 Tax=Crotalaria pallida TaxID=3830 RepID=A0AAN9F530_CROPI
MFVRYLRTECNGSVLCFTASQEPIPKSDLIFMGISKEENQTFRYLFNNMHDSLKFQIKKSITVGVIGLPNVGKSSLINSLRRSRVANVGETLGLTRSLQEVQLDKNIKFLDCPGVVMLKSQENNASVALQNCKRIKKLDDPIAPVKEILKLCPEKLNANSLQDSKL